MFVSHLFVVLHSLTFNPTSLTGLLSFMLSDEITTGSVNTTAADKRAYARLSHAWNIQQKRFKEAFPEVRHSLLYFLITCHLCPSSLTLTIAAEYSIATPN